MRPAAAHSPNWAASLVRLAVGCAVAALAWVAPVARGADAAPAAAPAAAAAGGGNPALASATTAVDDADDRNLPASISRLRAKVAAEPGNLGAMLDLAIAHCLAGEIDDAERLFLLLDSRPDLPPAIAEVIGWYRSGGCHPRSRPSPYQAFVAAGAGWARNLNLAPMADRIFLPAIGMELALAGASLRRDAPFATVEAGGLRSLTADRRWLAGAYAQAIRYRGAADYALTSAQGTLAWRDDRADRRVEVQGSVAQLAVGDGTRLFARSASAARLWPVAGRWWLGGAATATRIDYAEQTALNSRQAELRGRLQWQGSAARLTADFGWLEDRQVADRPGGDRSGPVIQAQLLWALPGGRLLEATARQGWLRDSAPYSPALFGDEIRTPRISTLAATLRQPLGPGINARLDLRLQRSSDSLALFDYGAQSVWVSLEWVFGAGR